MWNESVFHESHVIKFSGELIEGSLAQIKFSVIFFDVFSSRKLYVDDVIE